MVKNFLAFFFALIFCVACGNFLFDKNPDSNIDLIIPSHVSTDYQTSVVLPSNIPVTQPWHITYLIKTENDTYWQRMGEGAIASGEALGVNIRVIGSQEQPTLEFVEVQMELLQRELETGKMQGLIIGVADSIRLVPMIEKVIAEGIPVIAVDTPVNSSQLLTFIGFDNYSAGKTIAQWVVKQLNGKGNALILQGALHNDNAIARHDGFVAGLKQGEINILATQSANWLKDEAQQITEKWLEDFEQIDAIVSANDEMALGAIATLEKHNRKKVIVTGFDGLQQGLEAMKKGKLNATIDQLPEQQGKIAVELMVNYLETGEIVSPEILLKSDNLILPQSN